MTPGRSTDNLAGPVPSVSQAKFALLSSGHEVDLALRHDAAELVEGYIKPTVTGMIKSALISTAVGGLGAVLGSVIFGRRSKKGDSHAQSDGRSEATESAGSKTGAGLFGVVGGVARTAAIFAAKFAVRAATKAVQKRVNRKAE